MDGKTGDGDLLDGYLQEALTRLGSDRFEGVVRAADATCTLLADGHPAVLAGPSGEAFDSGLQWEYLALLVMLITGRTDHRLVRLPAPDGTCGWAILKDHAPKDSETLRQLRAGITRRASGQAALERVWGTG
ncbi:hypothetical protein ACFW7J_21695 [Streptomyces sp. NPDC059525]|uniref:hypothetical protein n=1 Tax=Streptomyces sp. NPDC059525 TaxID=3346857 RepID=UPI0036CB61E3